MILVHSKETTNLIEIDVDATVEEYDLMSKRAVTVNHNQIQEAWIRKQNILLLRGFNYRKYSIEDYIRIWESFVSSIETYLASHPDSNLTEVHWILSRESDTNQLLFSWNGKIIRLGL